MSRRSARICTGDSSLTDQDDIVQDTYTRLFRAREAGEIRHPKAFLFTTARTPRWISFDASGLFRWMMSPISTSRPSW